MWDELHNVVRSRAKQKRKSLVKKKIKNFKMVLAMYETKNGILLSQVSWAKTS